MDKIEEIYLKNKQTQKNMTMGTTETIKCVYNSYGTVEKSGRILLYKAVPWWCDDVPSHLFPSDSHKKVNNARVLMVLRYKDLFWSFKVFEGNNIVLRRPKTMHTGDNNTAGHYTVSCQIVTFQCRLTDKLVASEFPQMLWGHRVGIVNL